MYTDFIIQYRLSLEIQGMILGLPQLLFALAGGVVMMVVAKPSRHVIAGR